MRHRGEHVGNLYVAEMEGGREFTSEDEDTQVIFWGAVLVDRETGERVGKDDMEAESRELKRIPFARTYRCSTGSSARTSESRRRRPFLPPSRPCRSRRT